MNTTEYFKRTIQAYLEERAMEDELFAERNQFAVEFYLPNGTTAEKTAQVADSMARHSYYNLLFH